MKQITTAVIKQMKQNGEPVTMVTAYDYAMAKNVCEAGIEMILVGDSLGNVVLGYNSTVPVTMDEMIHHTKAVMRAAQGSGTMVVGDMPFMSYQASVVDGMYNAARFLKEVCELVQKLTQAGIPVVGHIGLTPQSVNQLGGFKVQGKSAEAAQKLLDDARALEQAGAFAIVLECVPEALAAKVTESLKTAATIGIGAGKYCDGQVLVCNDLLGYTDGFCPKFVKRYADLHSEMTAAFKAYAADVKARSFPAAEHTFKIDDEVLEKLY